MAGNDPECDDYRERIRIIKDLARQMGRAQRNFLVFQAGGPATHNPTPFDPRTEFECFVRTTAAVSGTRLTMEIMANVPDTVRVDGDLLLQCVQNFVSNAAKHAPGRSATIFATLEDEHLTVAVRDTGNGVDPDFIESLFNKGARDSETHGHGVGLFAVKQIVTAMKGTCGAKNTMEFGVVKGAEFWLRVPTLTPRTSVAEESKEAVHVVLEMASCKSNGPEKCRILVLDDVDFNNQLLCATAKAIGFEVSSATTPEEALELHQTTSFDICVLDIELGKDCMKGDAVASIIRQCSSPVPYLAAITAGGIGYDASVFDAHYDKRDFSSLSVSLAHFLQSWATR
jgi:CheY-like chemotaxis protein